MNSIRCRQCEHYIEANAGEGKIYGCDRSRCVFEPTTKNDLVVDKFDKAINQSDLEEWIMETFPDWCEGDVRLIMNHMDEMPSVTPQPRKGHWIAFDSDEDKYDEIKCDCCKKNFTVDAYHWTDIGFTKDDLNFCPNCGADMREVEE